MRKREAIESPLVIVDDALEVIDAQERNRPACGVATLRPVVIADGTYTPVRSGASALIQCPGPPLLGPRFHARR